MSLYKRIVVLTLIVGVLILAQGHYLIITPRFPSIMTSYSLQNDSDYNTGHDHLLSDNSTGTFNQMTILRDSITGANIKEVIPPSEKQLTRRAERKKKMKDTKKWQQAIDTYFKQYGTLCRQWEKINPPSALPHCPCIPGNFTGYQEVWFQVQEFAQISADNPRVEAGGHWAPTGCASRVSLAIIIPFRDRPAHLAILLARLHPFLQRQLANYTIYVVEQRSPEIFNKAVMMNTGFMFAKKSQSPHCVIFHDVDTIPEDDRHFYTCNPTHVLHIGSHLDVRGYNLAYKSSFGGVTSYTSSQFERVNGFSNNFFGWGGEDDNMGGRVSRARLRKVRDPMEVAGYAVVPHTKDHGNVRPQNYWKKRKHLPASRDGLNNLSVKVAAVEKRPLYTWLHVDVLDKVMAR